MGKLFLFDTTLRDGEQSPGCSMRTEEKVEFARQLERLRIDVIEAGFASSSDGDLESISAISETVKNCTVASLCRCRTSDIDLGAEAVKKAVDPMLHVFLATSPIHMKYKLSMREDDVLEAVKQSVAYARRFAAKVEFSAEDATRSDRDFLVRVVNTAVKAGACIINLPDTVGYSMPDEIAEMYAYVMQRTDKADEVIFSTHNHNDLGLAVSNTLAAVRAGARQVECTVNGIGERAGNAALEEVVMAMKTRSKLFDADMSVDTRQIYRTSKLLSSITGMQIPYNKAIVGRNAFSHEAGIHQHGVLKSPLTYEIITPESVGAHANKMVLGKHSGKHAIEVALKDMGYSMSPDELVQVYTEFKTLADVKKNLTRKDLEVIASHKQKVVLENGYKLEGYIINSVSKQSAMAMVKLTKDGVLKMKTCEGDGPVDAAFKAVNTITNKDFKLADFSLYAVTEGKDALGEAVIKLALGEKTMLGRGVSTDIIEASLMGYINAVNKLLF